MNRDCCNDVPKHYLVYNFSYEGQRHKGKVELNEDVPHVSMMYDDHDLEITWIKHVRHKGKYIELNITVNDDATNLDLCGKVVASAWGCVYPLYTHRVVIDEFEPDSWAYLDEENASNCVNKGIFYCT